MTKKKKGKGKHQEEEEDESELYQVGTFTQPFFFHSILLSCVAEVVLAARVDNTMNWVRALKNVHVVYSSRGSCNPGVPC